MTRCTILLLLAIATGCANQNQPPVPRETPPASAGQSPAVVESLRRAGFTVEPAGEIEQPFWGGKATVFRVEGDDLQVYRFADAEAARRAADQVAPGGGSIGTTMMSWIAPPHFYRHESTIVIYLGRNPRILEALRAQLGSPFAERA